MVLIRHAAPAEMEDLAGFTVGDPVGPVDAVRFREEAAAGRMRPEWTWFAADESRIVARALWWGRADGEHPVALDCLHVLPEVPDRAALAAGLLSRGHAEFGAAPDFNLVLRTGWRDVPAIAAAAEWRADAARAAGLTDVVERLRYEWTPAAGVPGPSGRLIFRPGEDEGFLAVIRRAAAGSLDVATQRDLAAMGADSQARGDWRSTAHAPASDRGGGWRRRGTARWPASLSRQRRRTTVTWGISAWCPSCAAGGTSMTCSARSPASMPRTAPTASLRPRMCPTLPWPRRSTRANYQVTEVRLVFQAPPG